MFQTSEWVSVGHPDKIADYISSYILDRYIERDPKTRYALEVQIKDNFVTLAGEVTSKAQFTPQDIEGFVRNGYCPKFCDETYYLTKVHLTFIL